MKRKPQLPEQLELSRARAQLSPMVRGLEGSKRGKIAISVRGKVSAYLVSKSRMLELEEAERHGARLEPPRLRGTLQVVGNLSNTSAAAQHRAAAIAKWDRANLATDRRSGR